MIRQIKKLINYVVLGALVLPSLILAMPAPTLAAAGDVVVSGGGSEDWMSINHSEQILHPIVVTDKAGNSIEETKDIQITRNGVGGLLEGTADIRFINTPQEIMDGLSVNSSGNLEIENATVTNSKITLNVKVGTSSNINDTVTISGIRVKSYASTSDNNANYPDYVGRLQLGVTTNAGAFLDSADTSPVDLSRPVIDGINSPAGVGYYKIGDAVDFTLIPYNPDANYTVGGVFNGKKLNWSTNDNGITYTSTYIVGAGDPDTFGATDTQNVVITDAAGNISAEKNATVAKKIDANAPVVEIQTPKQGWTYSGAPRLAYTTNEQTTDTVLIDGVVSSEKNGELIEDLSDGDHAVTVRSSDAAGNVTEVTNKFAIDTTSPAVTTTTNPNGTTIVQNGAVVFEGTTEPGAFVQLDVYSNTITHKTLSSADGSWRFEVPSSDLGAGSHEAWVTVTDGYGNSIRMLIAEFEITEAAAMTEEEVAAQAEQLRLAAASAENIGAIEDAVTSKTSTKQSLESLSEEVEDVAEGIIKAAETQEEDTNNPWQTVVTVIAILIIAIGVGTAGYYGYEWWATRDAVTLATSGPADEVDDEWDVEPVAKKASTKKKTSKKTNSRKTSKKSSSRW